MDVRSEVGGERVFPLPLEEEAVEGGLRLGVRHLGRARELGGHKGVRHAVEREVAQIAVKIRRIPVAAAARRKNGLGARKEGRRLFGVQTVADVARWIGGKRVIVKEQVGAVHAERKGIEVLPDESLDGRGQGL